MSLRLQHIRHSLLAAALTFIPIAAPVRSLAAYAVTSAADLLDINTATPAQLQALPGIGDNYVKRIIDGRPYTAKNQLAIRGILPQPAYDRIKDRIIAHHPAKR